MAWVKTTEEKYWEMLGVLPPAAHSGLGFMVGEAFDHDREGYPRYSAYVEIDGEFYANETPMRIKDFNKLTKADVVGAFIRGA